MKTAAVIFVIIAAAFIYFLKNCITVYAAFLLLLAAISIELKAEGEYVVATSE